MTKYIVHHPHAAGLAWDWINEKLYWIDEFIGEIGVLDPSTDDRRIIFNTGPGGQGFLFCPRTLIVDPANSR